jgi:hypothetical protein
MTPLAAALQVVIVISSALLTRNDMINLSARHNANASPDARPITQPYAIAERIASQNPSSDALPSTIIPTRI